MKKEQLTDFEWTLLWMSIRYAMNRQTISSATLPHDIIRNYYKLLSGSQKKSIVTDLKRNLEEYSKFGNAEIDNSVWMKFMCALDESCYYEVETIQNEKIIVFNCLGQIIPLEIYLESPHIHCYLPKENIKEKSSN